MRLARVTFSELYETEGAFGRESVSPGGAVFPKYLIYSYDLTTKTVVFPIGWSITESGGTNEDNRKRTLYKFSFGNFRRIVLRHESVEKIDTVEVDDYDPKEFQPNEELALMTLRVPRGKKNSTDELIQKYLSAETIVAARSKESTLTIAKRGRKDRIFPQHLYELVIQKSKWQDFAKELWEKNLVSKADKFAILANEVVFPRQLAYFKATP